MTKWSIPVTRTMLFLPLMRADADIGSLTPIGGLWIAGFKAGDDTLGETRGLRPAIKRKDDHGGRTTAELRRTHGASCRRVPRQARPDHPPARLFVRAAARAVGL